MFKPGQFHIAKYKACGLTGFLTCLLIAFSPATGRSQTDKTRSDTIFIKKGFTYYIFGSFIIPAKDTFLVKKRFTGDEEASKVFYDSVYNKFSRKKITSYIYNLAFRQVPEKQISDSVQVRKSEDPFSKYKNKIIRNISIITLDPFGTNVRDTNATGRTGAGKFLNSVHKKTFPYIIRNNLLIKKGMRIDPNDLGENEKHIRDLPYIHEVRTIVTPLHLTDSVDITIVTQDVWSIGFDVITITPQQIRTRLYDANFLGTGNRLSVTFSADLYRAPFFFFDGASYRINNISGSFIDVLGSFSADLRGNQTYLLSGVRDFYSNKVKWAGGVILEYRKSVSEEIKPVTSFLDHESFWLSKAWYLPKENRPTRLVISEAVHRVHFSSRPVVTIDTNRGYYNYIQIFTGLAYSRNNFYISDYLVDFGKTETMPYGNLFQINLGPEISDFYTRFYTGFRFAGGNFFRKFGYLSAIFRGGGFYYKDHIEDIVLKFETRYITPAITSPLQQYKFRAFFHTDFRISIRPRNNNAAFFNINEIFEIEKLETDTLLLGTKSLTATLSSLLYTPWYFYGFRFALIAQVQGGWVSGNDQRLLRSPFYMGTGVGIMTKNNNLIFPAIVLSLFYYPDIIPGVPPFQLRFLPDAALKLPDFNPVVPGTENIQN